MNRALRPGWADALRGHVRRPALVQLCLGFSSGLPYLLVFSTLSAWLRESGLSVAAIGWFALAGAAYVFKPAWAPVVNQAPIPFLTRRLGQRRSWLLLSQGAVALAILCLGTSDPAADLATTAFWAVVLAAASATQDIVADAYRIDSLPRDLEGPGTANFVNGYRVGVLASGAGALLIADQWGWAPAYGAMAALMAVGILTTLTAPEPRRPPLAAEAPFRAALVEPFRDFMTRRNWAMVLVFITLFQYGEGLLGVMANPFYLDIGFTKTDIALVTKVWGFAMSLAGAVAGGLLVARFGLLRALFACGLMQAAANLAFAWLAGQGPSIPALTLTIALENLTSAMATAAFVAYLSGLCDRAYSATQYALLSAFAALGRKIFVAGGGEAAQALGWQAYFIATTLAALPALLVLLWLMKKDRHFR
ncbi:MAG: MFS transporter [Rhodospirillales bacterium CG15_BIG_FIL_POST_REV_8_21_14_020_66_15]|nr:MAG: MFS transporter [Rhodospirillales bacterium CG15_BIG_FIL_POST_REV_8_21_14_020_66_15]